MPDRTVWRVAGHDLPLDTPLVMGICNVTPDSFSDGGRFADHEAAVAAARGMLRDGAAIIDVGGESTRPYAEPVSVEDELDRVLPVIGALASDGVVVSVDTSKPTVAAAALERGAAIVNDVTGLEDPAMRRICAEAGAGVVIMHMRGTPATMQDDPHYEDVVGEVRRFLLDRARMAVESGIDPEAIAIDPGIGFGKTVEHTLELLRNLHHLVGLGHPLLVGTSRKGFLGHILQPVRGDTAASERDGATAATIAAAVLAGADVVRVHDVRLGVEVAVTARAMVPEP